MELPKGLRSPFDRVLGMRLGRLLAKIGITPRAASSEGLLDLAGALLSVRGKASGPSLASAFFDLYEATDLPARQAFLAQLYSQYPRDADAINEAIAAWQANSDVSTARALNAATDSQCQRLIRLLNLAPSGTRRLIAMREDLLGAPASAGLSALDSNFEDLFSEWFNAGFLELRRLDWNSPAAVLERIIKYEAVHSIEGWGELRRRVEPADRRCYGFFHPQMADDPLIFVEVALMEELPNSIRQVIAEQRKTLEPRQASHAIFYSISNCQEGLRGIPFGNFLIKQVVGLLKAELSQLSTFATLSPVPGFARWLAKERGDVVPAAAELSPLAARYLLTARNGSGDVLDPVARFHLGNGARLEAVHAGGDNSAKGLAQSHGVMVNYRYIASSIAQNHAAFVERGEVRVSTTVASLLRSSTINPSRPRRM